MLGFRFDESRDAYVLRVVGRRFGPVLRTKPHDSAARVMDWPEEMQREEDQRVRAHRRTGRFSRDPKRHEADRREHSLRD